MARPDAIAHVEKIGGALVWHGALSFDYLVEDGTETPFFIDANPRLVEPMSALLSDVDLAGALLEISLGKSLPRQAEGKPGIVTRLGMMGLMDAAGRRGLRRDVVREIILLASGTGRYRGAVEELTPLGSDSSMRNSPQCRRHSVARISHRSGTDDGPYGSKLQPDVGNNPPFAGMECREFRTDNVTGGSSANSALIHSVPARREMRPQSSVSSASSH